MVAPGRKLQYCGFAYLKILIQTFTLVGKKQCKFYVIILITGRNERSITSKMGQ